jgi:tetratricopeptide (TPR) repeat protein
LQAVDAEGTAVILTGRCYERATVPFKALDSLVDALSRYLCGLMSPEVQAILPSNVQSLARLFPVLHRVEAVAEQGRRAVPIGDAPAVRRRASKALQDMLGRLAGRMTLVLFIDDLQWGDLDSAMLISDLLQPPDAPVMLLIGCYRSDDQDGPFLRFLRETANRPGAMPRPQQLAVDTLTLAESRKLATTLLQGAAYPNLDAITTAIARESGGSPFFVYELMQHLRQHGRQGSASPISVRLDQVVQSRVQMLPDTARRLLEVVAVCGRPIRLDHVAAALGWEAVAPATLKSLCSSRFLRTTVVAEEDAIETYHDRIRQTIVAQLSATEVQQHHLRLATALEHREDIDPEILAVHFRGAGEFIKAGRFLARAADHAAQSLAFDHAAELYRQALEHPPESVEETRSLWIKLSDALANAGRGAEAAAGYLIAADDAPAESGLRLRERAARQFFISGHFDRGLEIFRAVLRDLGMHLPRSPLSAIVRLSLRQVQLWLQGLRFQPRGLDEVSAEELMRFEACWSAVLGFTLVNPILGMYFSVHGVLVALRAGEPCRVVRSLAVYGAFIATIAGRSWDRVARLIDLGQKAMPPGDHPHETGLLVGSGGVAAFLAGEWQRSLHLCDQADELFRGCTGVSWELNHMHTFSLWALTYMGEVAELTKRWRVLRQDAEERGDRYALTIFGTHIMAVVQLSADSADEAQAELNEVIGRWSHEGYHVQHHNTLLAQALIHLYNGNATAAWDYVSERSGAYARSRFRFLQHLDIEMLNTRARCAVAAAAKSPQPTPLLRVAAKDCRKLEKHDLPWAHAWARCIRAGIAHIEGQAEHSRTLLTDAVARFERADMRLCAAAARRRLGTLIGGDEGRELVVIAESWMVAQGVKKASRISAMYTPGFGEGYDPA